MKKERATEAAQSFDVARCKDMSYLSDLQGKNLQKTDEENPQSILPMSLSHFSMQIIFFMLKESKTIRQLSEEFSIDPATIRRTLRRLIRHGFAAKVWRNKDIETNQDVYYYSSNVEVIEFCKARKEAQS